MDSCHLSSEISGDLKRWGPWGSSAIWSGTAKHRYPPGCTSFLHHISTQPDKSFWRNQLKADFGSEDVKTNSILYNSYAPVTMSPWVKHTVGRLSILTAITIQDCLLAISPLMARQDCASVPLQLTLQPSVCLLTVWLMNTSRLYRAATFCNPWASSLTDAHLSLPPSPCLSLPSRLLTICQLIPY